MTERRRSIQRLPTAIFLAVGGSLLGACWTTVSDGNLMRRRIVALEEGQAQHQESLRLEVENAQTKVAELEEVLDRATKVVTRNSADTGAQVETMQQQLMALEGQLAELRNEVQRQTTQMSEQQGEMERQLKKLAAHVGIESGVDESEIPASADAHFTAAQSAFEQRQYSRARGLYRAFMQRHPQDERADDAQYGIGASYLAEDRPATALGELRAVIADHPRGDMADDALFAMARAFYALHACTDARSALEAFPRAHPRSPLLPQVRELLRTVNRAPRGYCTR